jgi:hypothetical protein
LLNSVAVTLLAILTFRDHILPKRPAQELAFGSAWSFLHFDSKHASAGRSRLNDDRRDWLLVNDVIVARVRRETGT